MYKLKVSDYHSNWDQIEIVVTDVPDGISWRDWQRCDTNRFKLVAAQLESEDNSTRELRIIDLERGDVLAGRSLGQEFLINSLGRDTTFYLGRRLGNNTLEVKSYFYGMGVNDESLKAPTATLTFKSPSSVNFNNIWIDHFVPAAKATDFSYLIGGQWDQALGKSVRLILRGKSGGTLEKLTLPVDNLEWIGEPFIFNNELWINAWNGNFSRYFKLGTKGWSELPEDLFWQQLDANALPGSVVRDGSYALDLQFLAPSGGRLEVDSDYPRILDLPGDGKLIRAEVKFASEKLDIGYERWITYKDNKILSDKSFNSAIDLSLRSLKSSDEQAVYFQTLGITFTGTAGSITALSQTASSKISIYKVTNSQALGVLTSLGAGSLQTATGVTKVAEYTPNQLIGGGTLSAGQVAFLDFYLPQNNGSSFAWSAVYDTVKNVGSFYLYQISENGNIALLGQLKGGIEDYVVDSVQGIFFSVENDSDDIFSYNIDANTGKLTEIPGVIYSEIKKNNGVPVGVDFVLGETGDDELGSTESLDKQWLIGGLGNDTITAGAGSDSIAGGKGADSSTGGTGSDTFVFVAGDTGQATGSDTISDFGKGAVNTGDRIDYAADLVIGGNSSAATVSQALINQSTGVATFAAGSGTSLADALADIATRFTAAGDAAGEFALFRVGGKGNHYLFISDGAPGVETNDVVVQLVGVTSISGIALDGGNLTITS